MIKNLRLVVLFAICTGASSCRSDDTNSPQPTQLPNDIYTISVVYDVGNSNNASDIRVHLNFSTAVILSDIQEVRLAFLKATKEITAESIFALPEGSFVSIGISNAPKQIARPTATITDSDGGLMVNGVYKAYIAIQSIKDEFQLSQEKEFVLASRPVFAGDYVGTWEDLGPPGPATFPMSLRVADDYSGKMFYANAAFTPFGSGTQDALVTMMVSGTVIDSFVLDQLIPGYSGGCAATRTLTGNFEDEIELVLNTFAWADCDGTRDVKLKFTRQY